MDTRKVNVAQAWATGMGRARARFASTGLFAPAELDFAALAAAADGVSVLQPQGKRVGAQLPEWFECDCLCVCGVECCAESCNVNRGGRGHLRSVRRAHTPSQLCVRGPPARTVLEGVYPYLESVQVGSGWWSGWLLGGRFSTGVPGKFS